MNRNDKYDSHEFLKNIINDICATELIYYWYSDSSSGEVFV